MKTKNLLILFFLVCSVHHAFAQIKFLEEFPYYCDFANATFPMGINSAQQTSDSGYIVVATGSCDHDGFINVIKLDSIGNTKAYIEGGYTPGNFGTAKQTSDHGFIVSFYLDGIHEYGLLRTDTGVNITWVQYFTDTTRHSPIFSTNVWQTNDSGYISLFLPGSVWRVNSAGTLIWVKNYLDTLTENINSIQQTSDRGFILIGTESNYDTDSNDVYVVKTDANGDTVWTRAYGWTSNDLGSDIKQTPDGGYIILGSSTYGYFGNVTDVFLIKTDANGNVIWSKTYGNSGPYYPSSIQLTGDSGYIICAENIAIITNANGDTLKTIVNMNRTFMQQTSDGGFLLTDGSYLIKADSNGHGCYDVDTSLIIPVRNLLPHTRYPNKAVYDIAATEISDSGGTAANDKIDSLICRTVTGINEKEEEGHTFSIYPNPSSGTFNIYINKELKDGLINIFNIMGEKIYSEAYKGKYKSISIDGSPGIYFVDLISENEASTQKLIKE